MKILVMTDSPHLHSGMGTVGREISCYLATHGFEVFYIGWGQSGKSNNFPFKLIEVPHQNSGQEVFDKIISKERPTIVLTIGDPWMVSFIADPLKCKTRTLFYWVGYTAVDGLNTDKRVPKFWSNIILNMDKIITYTEYGQTAINTSFLDMKSEMISHGVCERTFKALDKQKCRELLGLPQDKYIYLFIGRNQPRKNIDSLLKIWKEFIKTNKDAVLYLHCNFNDPAGILIEDFLEELNIADTKTIAFSPDVAHGNSVMSQLNAEQLNCLYNMADCYISVSSEGFGLPTIEAMLTETPCLLLNHSASSCLGANGRAELINTNFSLTGTYYTERPYPDVTDAIKKMIIMRNKSKQEIKEMTSKAKEYALERTWDKIGEQWKETLLKIDNPLNYPILLEEVA